jgi:hypothetical protein
MGGFKPSARQTTALPSFPVLRPRGICATNLEAHMPVAEIQDYAGRKKKNLSKWTFIITFSIITLWYNNYNGVVQ